MPTSSLNGAEQELLDLFGTPGATATREQGKRWRELQAKIESGAYTQALTVVLNCRHHFEHDEKAARGMLLIQQGIEALKGVAE